MRLLFSSAYEGCASFRLKPTASVASGMHSPRTIGFNPEAYFNINAVLWLCHDTIRKADQPAEAGWQKYPAANAVEFYGEYMDYLQDPNNVAARRSSAAERNKWYGPDIDADDMRSPDEIAWKSEVAARAENLGPVVGMAVFESVAKTEEQAS